ncbi:MAG: hypothetical protein C0506_11685 [Anaerolinea sp.]|nr:hypothetical protein [Anaerolinea sp.]
MKAFQKGYVVAILLAVLTIVEYIFAVNFDNELVKFVGLSAAALAKVGMIGAYFMHFMRIFKTEEAH